MANMTLCWDCEKATGGCPWSDRLKPVKGWKAKELPQTSTRPYTTYMIEDCPLFVRDAYNGGLDKKPQREIKL